MNNTEQATQNGADWLSIGEAAKYLRVSRDTLRRWEKEKIIKSYRSPTNRRYYQKSDLNLVFNQKPDLQVKAIEKSELPNPPKKDEHKFSLLIITLLTTYIILTIFLTWLLLRTI